MVSARSVAAALVLAAAGCRHEPPGPADGDPDPFACDPEASSIHDVVPLAIYTSCATDSMLHSPDSNNPNSVLVRAFADDVLIGEQWFPSGCSSLCDEDCGVGMGSWGYDGRYTKPVAELCVPTDGSALRIEACVFGYQHREYTVAPVRASEPVRVDWGDCRTYPLPCIFASYERRNVNYEPDPQDQLSDCPANTATVQERPLACPCE